ncbi:MAG TPA: helix-turn-helix domain-containing protein [Thermomicrobiales bacterium]|jgi:excisionase family DNA binding protein|nr:MerR family transcriptional regulator [Chloroflexota bacterium]HCG29917.1 MerR family transcriptional regulator [Chloroflexota bacterium]HQX63920.1 helix-turn-helix domain-containing protein [Thermomicrobiales bacterium]HQZ90730.1 helix-turn-helix domain-containing protein [Thermomicrobiales bacterium]HRA32282.1 helix-turn-helix domain-containing protein [Thermomicrobiales bacterium]
MTAFSSAYDADLPIPDDETTTQQARPRRDASPPADQPASVGSRWLSIDQACQMLGVDPSTLRRWSDSGKVPVFRTPGGHRRYAEDDLKAIVTGDPQRSGINRRVLTNRSMSAYEHDYLAQARTRAWYRAYDPRTLDEMRPLGRRMVDLTIRYISGRGDRESLLDEGRDLGREYGYYSARVGLSTADALEAFLFFRTPVIQTVSGQILDEHLSSQRASRISGDLTHFMDQVLVATVRAHQAYGGGD